MCVVCGEVETFSFFLYSFIMFLFISEVSRYVVWPCCCRGFLYSGSKQKDEQNVTHYSVYLFAVISFDWTRLNAVFDSEGCAKGTSGATFPMMG